MTSSDHQAIPAIKLDAQQLLPYFTLLAAILAITYDTGYYIAIGFNFFTLFSLSEHLLFSMQTLPLVLVMLSIGILFVAFLLRIIAYGGAEGSRGRATSAILFGVLGMICGGIFDLLFEQIKIGTGFGIIGGVVLVAGLYSIVTFRTTLLVPAVLLSLMAFSFLTGASYALYDTSHKETRYTFGLKGGETLSGLLLRSGERGILLFNSAEGDVQFRTWDTIELIRRRAGSLQHR